jgi:AcrR family transcriptional regulator
MRTPRVDTGRIRREQIVEAAVAVITERGIQRLSLSAIEKKAGMSRGQLTYYFRAKEDILLAVFDRLLQLLYERVGKEAKKRGASPCETPGWPWVRHLLESVLLKPRASVEFDCLQHTFLSQIGHREDFRRRLATLYEEWRFHMGQGLANDLLPDQRVSPRALATVVQALLHGLAMQLAADPNAFDRPEVLELCIGLLAQYFRSSVAPAPSPNPLPSGGGEGRVRGVAKAYGVHRRTKIRNSIPSYGISAGR